MSRIPKLRFKEFNGVNTVQKLKEVIVSNTYGPRFNANDYDFDGNVKTIRGTDVTLDGNILYNQVPTAKLDEQFIKNHILQDDDLVIITTADCGLTGIFEVQKEKYICSAYAVKITFDKSLAFPQYFKYFFQTTLAKNEVNKYIRKATVANLPASDILRISHRLPQKQEQEKIASFLSSIDKKIEQISKKNELLDSYKKGVMQKIFSQEIRFSPKGTSSQAQGETDDGSDYSDWKEKKLGKLSDVRDGTHDSPKYYDEGYPLITSKNLLQNGTIDFNNVSLILKEDYININKRSKVNINDILFGMIGTIGNPVIVNKEGFAIKNVALIKEQELLLNRFLIHYLKSFLIEKQFYEQNTGGTQKFIALGVIRDLQIKLPCLEEQTKIANFLSSIDTKISQNRKALEETKKFKKALLQQMFV